MKYFLVDMKCGHMGKNKYVVKTFAIKAIDGKEAAKIARTMSRTKHHHKFAVISVNKVTKEEYMERLEKNRCDPYFSAHSVQEQRLACPDIYLETIPEEETIKYKKTQQRRNLVELSIIKELTKYKNWIKYDE